MPVRRHGPVVAAPRYSNYSNVRHDYAIDDSIHRADYLSNAVLEDTYEAATRSRGKDNELLRSVNAAIRPSSSSRDSTPTRISRPTKRLQSLPPVDIKPVSAVVPYRNAEKIRSALASSPPPTSLLSSRIDSYLRGSSLPPRPFPRDIASNISYTSYLPRSSSPSNIRSLVPYTSALSDSVRDYSPSYRSTSPYISRAEASSDYDYAGSDDEDYEPESFRRKYRIIRSPVSSSYHRAGSPDGSEDEYYDASDSFGTYSCPRPSGISPLKLSSYDGEYDGSYEADMAEMYDYVPFGPSRHGILELTHEDDSPLPSYTSSLPRLSPPRSSLPRVTVLPSYSRSSDVALPSPSTHPLLDSLVSSTAAKARAVLANSKLPEYKNASLVLSVEGSAVSEDGQNRYGFRYYPPPIPLRGSHIGLDERILSIAPKDVSPADSFLSKYLNRLRDIRTDIRDHVNRGDYARDHSVATVSSPSPYVHRTVTMPVHISGRAHSVPVSSYRSRLDGGQHHHVDVFPLVVSETSLPSDKKLHLPVYRAGGDSGSPTKLTVLEKINIKAAIIGSRMEADGPKRQRRPRSEFAANKLRELKRDELEIITTPSTVSSEGRSSVKIPAYYAAGGDPDNRPVSDLRRRIRRTLAKSKNNPDYFRD